MKKAIAFALGLALSAGAALADKLVVGAYPSNPPWEFKNERSEFEGFEVDMIREIASRMGREVEISDMGFQALFAATASGRIDVAISTITITNDRLQSQSFTQGYYDADMALVSVDGGATGLADMQGKPVGVLAASTGEAWVRANEGTYGWSDIRSYPDQQGLLLDVRAGRVAGAVSDLTGLIFSAKQMPDLKIVEVIPTGDRYGMMMPKGSPLLEEVNAHISAMKEDGTMAAIYERWFGQPPADGSATVTVLDIPQAQ
ncbi:MAG: ABC transporter substrate-binding protein [Gemmobacter sp.]